MIPAHSDNRRRAALVARFEAAVDRYGAGDPASAMLAYIIQLHDQRIADEPEPRSAPAPQPATRTTTTTLFHDTPTDGYTEDIP
jgi:hypothetical protein